MYEPLWPSWVPRSVIAVTDLPSWPLAPFWPSWPFRIFWRLISLPSPSLIMIVTPICFPSLSRIGCCSIVGVLPSLPSTPFLPSAPFWPSATNVSLINLPRVPSGFTSYTRIHEPVWLFCSPRAVTAVIDLPSWPFVTVWRPISLPSPSRVIIVTPICFPSLSNAGIVSTVGVWPSLPGVPFLPSWPFRMFWRLISLPSPSLIIIVTPICFPSLSWMACCSTDGVLPFSPFAPSLPFKIFSLLTTFPSPSVTVIVTPIWLPELSRIGVCSIFGVLPSSPFSPFAPFLINVSLISWPLVPSGFNS